MLSFSCIRTLLLIKHSKWTIGQHFGDFRQAVLAKRTRADAFDTATQTERRDVYAAAPADVAGIWPTEMAEQRAEKTGRRHRHLLCRLMDLSEGEIHAQFTD
ncbi:hypothetical protein CCMA1212_001165 [Trichoderma ghanense]|uniref:Uncharacterized protein n=1 Tax=Trichoderma ghanense TaxID=65468 RepID=A0ABY2HIM9_9HYPO